MLFRALFLLVWLDGIAFFYVEGVSVRDGSNAPTARQSEPVTNHGRTVYVTREQDQLRRALQTIFMVGLPLVIVGGLALHKLAGVELYPGRSSRTRG